MKNIPLLPRYFRWVGMLLIVISLVIYLNGILEFLPFSSTRDLYIKAYSLMNTSQIEGQEDFNFGLHNINLGYLLIIIPSLIGLTLLSFSKTQHLEDEFISNVRLQSWSFSIIIFLVYCLMINMLTYGSIYLSFAVVSPHLLLLAFILIFKVKLFKLNRRFANEE